MLSLVARRCGLASPVISDVTSLVSSEGDAGTSKDCTLTGNVCEYKNNKM